jgi:CubicO group peptidase (beta-lactamase class C family)
MFARNRGIVRCYIWVGIVALTVQNAGAQDLHDRIQEYLDEQVQKRGIPGLTVAVVRDGQVVYTGAFGVRELGKDERLTPEHVFHFASVSKPFVATAIVQLMERGKLSLDDPVRKHLPYFRLADERFTEITVRQMLNHTSGVPDVEDYEWDRPQLDEGSVERYVRSIASERLLWAPGGGWLYSNLAFDVLGDLIAKVSGQSFEAYMRSNIFDPLGMDGSSFVYPEINNTLRTSGHVGTPARVSKVYPYNRRHAPRSTLNSSVAEMTRWILANLNQGELDGHRILKAESHDLLWTPSAHTPRDDMVGLSWFLGEYAGHRTVFHGGADTGFRSMVMLLPDDDIGIVLASNWDRTDRDTISRGIVDVVLHSDKE